ncbi:MAG: hypothetical protein JWO62_1599 [Acidimicrobiaceae bacterium]|nr:hypothetical protein [Acidimicrobiaceae bacterium]
MAKARQATATKEQGYEATQRPDRYITRIEKPHTTEEQWSELERKIKRHVAGVR